VSPDRWEIIHIGEEDNKEEDEIINL